MMIRFDISIAISCRFLLLKSNSTNRRNTDAASRLPSEEIHPQPCDVGTTSGGSLNWIDRSVTLSNQSAESDPVVETDHSYCSCRPTTITSHDHTNRQSLSSMQFKHTLFNASPWLSKIQNQKEPARDRLVIIVITKQKLLRLGSFERMTK